MNKGLKVFVWVFFFPFMLAYWGYSKKNKPATVVGSVLSALIILIVVFGDDDATKITEEDFTSGMAIEDRIDSDTKENVSKSDQDNNEEIEKSSDNSSILNENDDKVIIDETIDINEEMLKKATGLTSEELELLLSLINNNDLDAITDIQDGSGDSVDTLKAFRVWFGDDQAIITFEARDLYYFGINETVYFDKEELEISENTDNTADPEGSVETESEIQTSFLGYRLIEVDGGDLSGDREPLVVVDIGYSFRQYWAFTNEYGQLVKVIADQIVLQDDDNEPVLSTGRYYPDEAKVPGTELTGLDEGHVIADSLGGVANAYNITPQNSTLNRHGDQAYMEEAIRQAGGCTDFEVIITYPNTITQIPSSYKFTYTINGKTIVDEFDNIDPDEVNKEIDWTNNSDLVISLVDKAAEEVTISNTGENSINLSGYKLVSVTGNQSFVFSDYLLNPGEDVVVYGKGGNGDIEAWKSYVWNNSSNDPAELYDPNGTLLSRY